MLLRWEARIALAALRRILTHGSRRALWFVTGTIAAAAIAFDVATSDVAARDLGRWSPSPLLVAAVAAGLVALAALFGSRTPLTYGTRAADVTWWRYAGVGMRAGQRATNAILALRAMVLIALGGVPVAALLVTAAPQRAATVVALAAAAIGLAPVTVLVSSAFAPRAPRDVPEVRAASAAAAVAPHTSRIKIPAGLAAARWLVAARCGELLVPYDRFAFGLIAGFVAPRFTAGLGGQAVSLAIVVGGLALVLDAAIRGTTAPAALRSPWWRAAIGTSPRALAAWALGDALGAVALFAGIALGAGVALGAPLPAFAALPAIALVPVALRLVVLAVDTFFPAAVDRRGAGASVRIAVVAALTAATLALALVAGAHGGAFASIAALTAALLAVATAAAWCSSVKLPAAIG